jgi:hypothetical protein
LRHTVEDILNLSPHPLDWTWEIVEDLPCNEIATTTNPLPAMFAPVKLLVRCSENVTDFLPVIREAIANGGAFDEDYADIFKLEKLPAGAACDWAVDFV